MKFNIDKTNGLGNSDRTFGIFFGRYGVSVILDLRRRGRSIPCVQESPEKQSPSSTA